MFDFDRWKIDKYGDMAPSVTGEWVNIKVVESIIKSLENTIKSLIDEVSNLSEQ